MVADCDDDSDEEKKCTGWSSSSDSDKEKANDKPSTWAVTKLPINI